MLAHLDRSRARAGFRVALMMHDLIPSLAPQYVTWNDDSAAIATIRIADLLIVNSDATTRDVTTMAQKHLLAIPEVIKLPMASAVRSLRPVRPTAVLPKGRIRDGNFVLCVGTVTIRKNHQLLLDVWEQLADVRGPSQMPALIIAGQRRWLCDETMSRLERTPALQDVVFHISDATDENIAWLYEHCLFTVFPSLYEGWGLPVSESHDFGKVCLTSDRTSLPEVGEGLAEMLDPTDRNLWLERVLHYSTNITALRDREDLIRAVHQQVQPRDAANTILRVAGIDDSR